MISVIKPNKPSVKSLLLVVLEKNAGSHLLFHSNGMFLFLASYAPRAYRSPVNSYNFAVVRCHLTNTRNVCFCAFLYMFNHISINSRRMIKNQEKLTLSFIIFRLVSRCFPKNIMNRCSSAIGILLFFAKQFCLQQFRLALLHSYFQKLIIN